jgi:uncharacterized protein
MAEHPNVTLVRRGFAAFNAGDIDTLREIMADDAIQHMPGNHSFSGDHKGFDNILAMYGQVAELTGGTFQVMLEDVYANDHRAVATFRGQATRDSQRLDKRYALIFEIIDGRAIDLEEIVLDGAEDDDFWS